MGIFELFCDDYGVLIVVDKSVGLIIKFVFFGVFLLEYNYYYGIIIR